MLIDIIAGARPNFMKVAALVRALDARAEAGGPLRYRLVHTGQHYDPEMSDTFFEQLGIPVPHVNLDVGPGSQAEVTAAIMVRYEQLLVREPSNLCVVVGDVTSTMACAITARKQHIRVAHVEAGIRSGDMSMPEEINRIVTDSISDWLFTTSTMAGDNLREAGVDADRIHFVGNTMIDTLLTNRARFRKPAFFDSLPLDQSRYLVLTLHRPSNVDNPAVLEAILARLADKSRGLPIIFPVHPRTAAVMARCRNIPKTLHRIGPQGYLEFNWIVANAFAVITDSGGISEETTVMGIPCLTLRNTTERPETVTIGTNRLIGSNPECLEAAFDDLFARRWKKGAIPPLWDGHAATRIVSTLENLLSGSKHAADGPITLPPLLKRARAAPIHRGREEG